MCQELIEIGLQLTRAFAQKALADLAATPEPAQTPEPAPEPAPPSKPAPPDPALTFARLSRAVRQCVALEATIAAGNPTLPKRAPYDPRRAPIRRMFDEATRKNPERREIRREAENLLDQELLADPNQETPLPDLFHSIVAELGLHIDPATISNRSLNDLCPGEEPLSIPETHDHRPERTSAELLAIARGDNHPITFPEDPPAPPANPPPPLPEIAQPPPPLQTFTPSQLYRPSIVRNLYHPR